MAGQDVRKSDPKSFFDRPQRDGRSGDSLSASGLSAQSRQTRNLIFQFGISPVWQHCTQDVLVCPPQIGAQKSRSNVFLMDFNGQTSIDNRRWISITDDDLPITDLSDQYDEGSIEENEPSQPGRHRSKST